MAEAGALRRLARVVGLGLSLVLGLLLALSATGETGLAAERQLHIRNFAMEAEVSRDGSMQIRETLAVHFDGSWRGLRRQIPELARRPGGLEPLGLGLIAAEDGQGHPYQVETEAAQGHRTWRIVVPGAQDATRTIVLRYQVRNAVRFYPDHDEINWNVTGNAWETPIERVSARVRLPEGVSGVHAAASTGLRGVRGRDARLQIGPRQVTVESTRALGVGEGLTLAVGFDKGLVTPPAAAARTLAWLRGRLALLLPPLVLVLYGPIWWRWGRDPALGSLPVVYEPPKGLTPAEVAALVREQVETNTLGATVVDLAVKGYLHIDALKTRRPFLGQSRSYRFTLLQAPKQWLALARHEQYLLQRLFPYGSSGDRIDSEALRESFYVHVPGFLSLVQEAEIRKGFFLQWPETVRAWAVVIGWAVTLLVVMLAVSGVLLPPDLTQLQVAADPWLSGLGVVAALLLVSLIGWAMPRRTPQGVAVLRQALGFEEFLRRVEAPRYRRVIRTPELFERWLAYAMVAGLTRQWTAAFRGIVQERPAWFGDDHDGSFDVDVFGEDIEDCGQDCGEVLHSSPSSTGSDFGSSDSGSWGGGSSGDGDGGGGGGGF
jgi:uncharacterized membrane protein YgcG